MQFPFLDNLHVGEFSSPVASKTERDLLLYAHYMGVDKEKLFGVVFDYTNGFRFVRIQ